jgi:protein phosphatase
MKINLPEFSLVVLIGPSGSGKSTFARKHFKPTEVLSSDFFRGLISDDESNQAVTAEAFDALHYLLGKRLAAMRLSVVDATNLQPDARKPLLALARRYHCLPTAVVFNLPEQLCQERNQHRTDRRIPAKAIRLQWQNLRRTISALQGEGFRYVHLLDSPEAVDATVVGRTPLWSNRKHERGPFDLIGDVHGCFEELTALLGGLGYEITRVPPTPSPSPTAGGGEQAGLAPPSPLGGGGTGGEVLVRPPDGRKAIFVGDLVDRGPNTPAVLRLVMGMVEAGTALCVPGNHDDKLLRKLKGNDVQLSYGLAASMEQLGREPPEFVERVRAFLDGLVSHYVLDDGKLVVAHAGMKESLQGRASGRVRAFALYGETTGETDEFGLPVRYNWAAEYRGPATVVYGHTPVPESEWFNRTINIDTGCVFGGKLTALRYPEKELVSVPAARTYCEPARPFLAKPPGDGLTAQQQHDDLLDLEEVLGKRQITTRLLGNVTIREENAAAALEVMSRFAADPRWLIYLPPTMSPCETSREPGLLEHPAEAFAYYRHQGVPRAVCQEKHMGSRAVVIVCRDEDAARRFGVVGQGIGICTTRTGRRFFDDAGLEAQLLERVRSAAEAAGLWQALQTDWLCLDCELMPWSAKAQELLRQQYAAVGSASRAALAEAVGVLQETAGNNAEAASLLQRYRERAAAAARFTDAYRHYCWPVNSVTDLKLAPFHLLASEGAVHADKDHAWHMEQLAALCRADASGVLLATPFRVVDVTDAASQGDGVRWWTELTERGGEGMVVKPFEFVARGRRGLAQPAVKCRGREYLRIIYGPEYTAPEHLERLRQRGLSAKRSLALREFALGVEGLERFVRREPLRRVHECSFGVLALESEPVDPRL